MSRNDVAEKLAGLVREIFDDETLEVTDTTTAADVEDWDSLEQINILVAAEKAFSVKFSIAEVEGLKNVGEMVDLIVSKL